MAIVIQQLPPTQIENVRTISSSRTKLGNSKTNLLVDNDLMDQIYLKDKFISLKRAWESNTMFSSSVSDIIEDSNFKRIVQMGPKIIPVIIEEIDKKPSSLVWVLNLITGKTLKSTARLTVSEACKVWVKLYKDGKISLN